MTQLVNRALRCWKRWMKVKLFLYKALDFVLFHSWKQRIMTNSFTIREVHGFTGEARGFLGGSVVKNPSTNVEATGGEVQSLSWEDSPGKWNGNSLQHSCLGNPMKTGAWRPQSMGSQESNATEYMYIRPNKKLRTRWKIRDELVHPLY